VLQHLHRNLSHATPAASATASRGLEGIRLFGPFRLNVRDQRLWRGDKELKLRRKPYAILRYLTDNPKRLVTQLELVQAVWGYSGLSESLVRTHIGELRRILGEDVIETVVGRGYRFLLGVEVEKRVSPSSPSINAPSSTARLVGRDGEGAFLHDIFETALQEKRQMVFITGDPGVGKTALVDAFLAQIAASHGALIASGACLEQSGTGEAYLPVLAALGAACRGPDGESIIELLARHAPTWLAQMPGLVPDEDLQGLLLRVQGPTQSRMLRELAEALDVIAAQRPLVLLLEDTQWADDATLDLIGALGARREAARAMVITTCSRAELTKGAGLAKIIAQLGARKLAHTLHLENWSVATVAEYLKQRYAGPRFPEELAIAIHQLTAGNPLFTIGVVDGLESQQMVRCIDGAYRLSASVAEVLSHRPDTVQRFIDIQIDRLPCNEQRILEAASLVGLQFTAGAVGCALALPADDVDSMCEGLAREGGFLRFVTTVTWPDGTIQSRYSFVHALYRDAALARVPSATKRVWQRRIAEGHQDGTTESSSMISLPSLRAV
jgi:DNA-binding winged helix-turn-helix (wHTH) protein